MSQNLDLNGILISSLGERTPCKLVNINDKGYLEIYSIDAIENNSRVQLIINTPRIQSGIRITAVVPSGDTFLLEAIPEEPLANIQAKIVEHRVRELIK